MTLTGVMTRARSFWLLAVMVYLSYSLVTSVSAKCLVNKAEVLPKRHLYFDRRSHSIVIEASDRASHRLVSHVLEILLTEVLGYDAVEVKHDHNSIQATQVLNRLAACQQTGCHDNAPGSKLPDSMISLEVWSKVGFSAEPWLHNGHLVDAGPLGSYGRFGWFVPVTDVVRNWNENSFIIDHWRALTMVNITSQFNMLQNLDIVEDFLTRPSTINKTHYCEQVAGDHAGICHKGLLYGKKCLTNGHARRNNKCAVLLSSYPDLDNGLLDHQINMLDLNVVVAWTGNHLDNYVHKLSSENKPILFFNWVPNTLTASGNYTDIQFPSCENDEDETDDLNINSERACNFQVHQLSKYMWSGLKKHSPEAAHVVSSLQFSQEEYENLLKVYMEINPDYSINDHFYKRAACEWVKRNEDKWSKWIPENLSNTTKIYLGGMYPLASDTWKLYGVPPAVEMAMETINSLPNILKNFELVVLKRDTMCKADLAMAQFMNYIENDTHPVAGILGPACLETAEAVSSVSKYYNTIIVSYAAETSLEPDPKSHPLFFRTQQPRSHLAVVYTKWFQHFRWKRVILLAQNTNDFSEYQAYLRETLSQNGISVLVDAKLPRNCKMADAKQVLEDVQAKQGKIIILTSFQICAVTIMCQAYQMNMTPKYDYVWFMPNWFTGDWWQHGRDPCNRDVLFKAIQGYFQLSPKVLGSLNDVMISNQTVSDWLMQWIHIYHQRVPVWLQDDSQFPYAAAAYDSVWVFALALNKLLEEDPSALGSLRTDNTTQRLLYHLNATHFQGASGLVTFKAHNRLDEIHIHQFINKSANEYNSRVGVYSPFINDSLQLDVFDNNITWLGEGIPSDSPKSSHAKTCGVESFRALLGVSCDTAIVIANVIGISVFALVMIICLIIVKKRYDDKVLATRHRMVELGLMADTSWLSLDQWEVPREHVVLNRKLGEGAFGMVYGGEALFEGVWVAVAVKTLKVGSNPEEKLDFLSEAEMMKRFDHPNIVKLMGVCTRGEPAYNVMEFMLHGDLKTFLLSRRNMVGQDIKEAEDITSIRLTQMALDVAKGLAYLSELGYVHRDIACRNCLINAKKTVKIGDFGMTRAMFDSDYYRFNKRGMLPVRWMAPESLTDGLFTPHSDVWSYGVLLYEIMTFGSFPYQGLSNKQVLDHVKAGNTIVSPSNCSTLLRDLLQACWSYESEFRPNILEIVEVFSDNQELIKPCLDAPSTAVAIETTGEFALDPPPKQRIMSTGKPIPPHNRFSISNVSEQSHAGIDHHGTQSPPSPNVTAMDPFSLLGNMARGATAKLPSLSSVIRSPLSRSLSVGEERVNPPVTLAPMYNHTRLLANDAEEETLPGQEDEEGRGLMRETLGSRQDWPPDNMYHLPRHISIPASLEEKADSDYSSDHSKDFIHCHMSSALSSIV